MFLVPRFRYFKLVFYPYVFNMISFLLKLVGLRPGPVICSVCEDSNLGPIAVDSRSTRKGDEAAGMPVNNNWGVIVAVSVLGRKRAFFPALFRPTNRWTEPCGRDPISQIC